MKLPFSLEMLYEKRIVNSLSQDDDGNMPGPSCPASTTYLESNLKELGFLFSPSLSLSLSYIPDEPLKTMTAKSFFSEKKKRFSSNNPPQIMTSVFPARRLTNLLTRL